MENSNRINNKNGFKQGRVLTENLKGYTGKKSVIELLSGYEFKTATRLQQMYTLGRISGWSNEESVFKYVYSLDGQFHRYYMDFTIDMPDGSVFFIEVKPYTQTIPPKKPKTFKNDKQKRNYDNQMLTFIKNSDKWSAVEEWCKNENKKLGINKFRFVIWTEKELSI